MSSKWWVRFVIMLVIVVSAGVMVTPTVLNLEEEGNFPVKSKVNLGLDLQGGLYMVLGIDFEKAYRDEVSTMLFKSIDYLKDQGVEATIGDLDTTDNADPRRSISIQGDVEAAKLKIKEYYPTGYLRLVGEAGQNLTYALHGQRRRAIEEEAVSKSIEVIRNRIDEFGVTEPEITSQGEDRIVVQLPGVKDIERAKDLIGKTAKLEFKLVNTETSPAIVRDWMTKLEDEKGIKYDPVNISFSKYLKELNEFSSKDLPKGYVIAFEKKTNSKGEVIVMEPLLVEENSDLTGDDLQDAFVSYDPQTQAPETSLIFKSKGAKKFETLTTENKGRLMAIVLDGNVYSAPRINEPIAGGRARIMMGNQGGVQAATKEASDLALILRAGALPVQLEFQEQRVVGPQLGEDSIQSAKKASAIGISLVFIFILIYYKVSGFIALVCLSLNVLFILACLVGLEATLTLPGIAGIALTVGMAVDASIIIFERIREEIRKGLSGFKAVENGFSTAFWTILDANFTTALAGLSLLNFGTGPIRGFAVTLLIGIAATVYTSYYIGQLIFQFYMNKTEGKGLSI